MIKKISHSVAVLLTKSFDYIRLFHAHGCLIKYCKIKSLQIFKTPSTLKVSFSFFIQFKMFDLDPSEIIKFFS